jgi:hypothetical protein
MGRRWLSRRSYAGPRFVGQVGPCSERLCRRAGETADPRPGRSGASGAGTSERGEPRDASGGSYGLAGMANVFVRVVRSAVRIAARVSDERPQARGAWPTRPKNPHCGYACSVKWNVVATRGSLSTQMVPPCISTIRLAMNRPNPVPPGLLENRLGAATLGDPGLLKRSVAAM